jgi:hypothetical protein
MGRWIVIEVQILLRLLRIWNYGRKPYTQGARVYPRIWQITGAIATSWQSIPAQSRRFVHERR